MVPNGFSQIAPHCFLDSEEATIRYKGHDYHKACGVLVFEDPHGGKVTHCIIRAGHKSDRHEDVEGRSVGGQQTIEGLIP